MKIASLVLTLFLAVLIWPQPASTQSEAKPEELAQKAAESWLALTDSGKYAESWEQAATDFRDKVTKGQWIDALTQVRAPLGKVVSRKLQSATYTTAIPKAPAGQYVIIRYSTDFENAKNMTETVTPMLDKDGKWRVSGYFIKPTQ